MAETTYNDATADERLEGLRAAPCLFVVLECDRPRSGGARYSLADVDEVVVGRGDERTAERAEHDGVRRLFLCVPGRSMSSTHARIVRRGKGWTLEDCGSTNGSFVDSERITRRALTDGDLLALGHTLFLFRESVPSKEPLPLDADATTLAPRPAGLATLLPARSHELEALARVAASTLPVLLIGESGTGKEVLANAVHHISRRPGKLVAINCGALTATLLESQLFGHVKGAFSGALRDEPGLVRAAEGGTLFLDEIGDLPLASQASLLRVVQEHEVVPVGSARACKVDVRIVAATHRSLQQLASRGEFRADLLARLDGFTHTLPPLRARREDMGSLVADLLRSLPAAHADVRFSSAAGHALLRYDWPLNVRELGQALARSTVLATDGHIDVHHLPPSVASAPERRASPPRDDSSDVASDADRRSQLVALLDAHGGNVSEVARVMGKARMQVHRWVRRFGIPLESYRR